MKQERSREHVRLASPMRPTLRPVFDMTHARENLKSLKRSATLSPHRKIRGMPCDSNRNPHVTKIRRAASLHQPYLAAHTVPSREMFRRDSLTTMGCAGTVQEYGTTAGNPTLARETVEAAHGEYAE